MTDDNNAQTPPETEAPNPKQRRSTATRRISTPRFVISISQERIATAVQRDSSHCMVAEAIKEARPELTNVDVALDSIRFTDKAKNLRYVYLTPREAQIGLINFDRGVMPKPFSFLLTRAVIVTRSHRKSREPLPRGPAELERKRIARQDRRAANAAIAQDEPFRPSADRVADTLRALEDPDERLGPAVAIPPATNGMTSQRGSRSPVIVGGSQPRRASGNLAKTRRFGIRQYLE